jgi:type I restriction enzyme, S subunit
VPVPPLQEQAEIVNYLELETTKLDSLESAMIKTIDLLKERRTALIAATVTGQHPIPETSCN